MIHFVHAQTSVVFLATDYFFAGVLRGLGAYWDDSVPGWSVDDAGPVWEFVSRQWGMRAVCIDCLQDECSEAHRLVARLRQQRVALRDRFYSDKAVVRRTQQSTSTELELRPTQQTSSPTKQAAAAAALGLGWPVGREEIVRAFRKAAFERHPDRGGSDQAMIAALLARDILLR